jgi:hypothetical protein
LAVLKKELDESVESTIVKMKAVTETTELGTALLNLIKIQQDIQSTLHQRKKSVGEALVRNHQKDVRVHSRNILSSTINRRGTASTANKYIP